MVANQDGVVFDYNGCPMDAGIMDYIAALVRSVRETFRQMGLTRILPAPLFVFKMSSRLWEGICNLYACRVPDDVEWATIEGAELRAAELGAKQSIFVDGIPYPIELDESLGNDILFVPRVEEDNRDYARAALQNVGVLGGWLAAMNQVVYGPALVRIEASQKGWYAARALAELIEAIAVFETGNPDWDKYLSSKGATLLALKGFELWHGKIC